MRSLSMRAAVVVVGAGALVLLPVASAGAASGPHVKAHPKSVMVNHDTVLSGRGFPAGTSIDLAECSAKHWIAPNDPCGDNTVTVTTNGQGRFTTTFRVTTCPGGVNHGPGFSQRCYIGEPQPAGVDTTVLVGATKITVTGP
jgi:hypothetical protein